MNKPYLIRTLWGTPLLLVLVLGGCTYAAKDFGGSWKPVNHFQTVPTEIPLNVAYSYYASPMDGTLKTMLTRWSKDAGMVLSYQLTADYTLIQPVSKIQTNDVRAAAAELTTIYAGEGIYVSINDKQILVSVANVSKPDASESRPAPAPEAPAASATSAAPTTSTAVTPATPASPATSETATPAAPVTSPTPSLATATAITSGTPATPAGNGP